MGRRSQYSFSKRQRELKKKKKKEDKLSKKQGGPEDEENGAEPSDLVEETTPTEPEVVDLSEFLAGPQDDEESEERP